jgi:hypothetical protein
MRHSAVKRVAVDDHDFCVRYRGRKVFPGLSFVKQRWCNFDADPCLLSELGLVPVDPTMKRLVEKERLFLEHRKGDLGPAAQVAVDPGGPAFGGTNENDRRKHDGSP